MGAKVPWSAWFAAAGLGAIGLAAFVLVGAPPAPLGLAWLALAAAPAGVLAAGLGRAGWLPPVAWAALLGLQGLPWPGLVAAGLFAAGAALGLARPVRRWGDAGWVLLLGALLAGLPSLAGLAGAAPWSPRVAALTLDLSPVVLLVESAGVDWLRHPAVYAPAGGDALGPDLRVPWSGRLAGTAVLLVGCALLAASRQLRADRND